MTSIFARSYENHAMQDEPTGPTVSSTLSAVLMDSSPAAIPPPPISEPSETLENDTLEDKSPRLVRVPEMFGSLMSVRPVVNPSYHIVKPKGDVWITRIMGKEYDTKWGTRNSKVDLCYLASIWAPESDADALRTMLDWNHWVFLFDDQFDEGHLSHDPEGAQEEIERTMAIMEGTEPRIRAEENPIRYVFQTCWDRIVARACPELSDRYKEMHRRFFVELVTQVKAQKAGEVFTRDVNDYMNMRRGTIGAYPAIALTEYAVGITLSNEIINHPSLQECMCISADLVLLVNDILSYKKDLVLGVDHNLISLLMRQGLSMQQSADRIGEMINECYKRWYVALGNLPSWGEDIDREVLKFVDICRNVALGNLHWSFKTGRYLGASEGEQVHETRLLHIPELSQLIEASKG